MDRDEELLSLIEEQYRDMIYSYFVRPESNVIMSLDQVIWKQAHGADVTLLDVLADQTPVTL